MSMILGPARIAHNLDQLAKVADVGTLPMAPGPNAVFGPQALARPAIVTREAVMIPKGSQRGGATQLGPYFLRTEENTHVERTRSGLAVWGSDGRSAKGRCRLRVFCVSHAVMSVWAGFVVANQSSSRSLRRGTP
ncbi:MAG: hypothetical protein AAF501_02865 [Pseudomonadota bacterium]